jgi:ATP-dependent DNA helicase RecQ
MDYQSWKKAEKEIGIEHIMSHLAKLYIDGKPVDLTHFVSHDEVQQIAAAKLNANPVALKPYFDYFEEKWIMEKLLALVQLKNRRFFDSKYSMIQSFHLYLDSKLSFW